MSLSMAHLSYLFNLSIEHHVRSSLAAGYSLFFFCLISKFSFFFSLLSSIDFFLLAVCVCRFCVAILHIGYVYVTVKSLENLKWVLSSTFFFLPIVLTIDQLFDSIEEKKDDKGNQ